MSVLVSGCSFTACSTWPNILFSGHTVNNVGAGAAGNQYIAQSIIDSVRKQRPDFVFLLWSGLRRLDISFPKDYFNSEFKSWQYKGSTSTSCILFSGGDWTRDDGNDPPALWGHPIVDAYFKMQYKNKVQDYLMDQSSQAIMNCHNFLESQSINYKFSFIYNIFNPYKDEAMLGPPVTKNSNYFTYLNWEKYIDTTPLEWAIKHDHLSNDNFHPTQTGMNAWAEYIKPRFKELS